MTVDASGAFQANITLPSSAGPGYHTVILNGLSYSGEPITLYQFVTVTSGIENDIDGDGIPDDQDRCLFITEWLDESSGVDVCKTPEEATEDHEPTLSNIQSASNKGNFLQINRVSSRNNPELPNNTLEVADNPLAYGMSEGSNKAATMRPDGSWNQGPWAIFAILVMIILSMLIFLRRVHGSRASKT